MLCAHSFPLFCSTYKWDTCAGHAILLAQGTVLRNFANEHEPLYHFSSGLKHANEDGLIAVANDSTACALRDFLKDTTVSPQTPKDTRTSAENAVVAAL